MEHDKEAARRSIDALKAKLRDLASKPRRIDTAIEGVWLYRQTEDVRIDCFNEPCIGVIVQRGKDAGGEAQTGLLCEVPLLYINSLKYLWSKASQFFNKKITLSVNLIISLIFITSKSIIDFRYINKRHVLSVRCSSKLLSKPIFSNFFIMSTKILSLFNILIFAGSISKKNIISGTSFLNFIPWSLVL
jgi:hypothetical protein